MFGPPKNTKKTCWFQTPKTRFTVGRLGEHAPKRNYLDLDSLENLPLDQHLKKKSDVTFLVAAHFQVQNAKKSRDFRGLHSTMILKLNIEYGKKTHGIHTSPP